MNADNSTLSAVAASRHADLAGGTRAISKQSERLTAYAGQAAIDSAAVIVAFGLAGLLRNGQAFTEGTLGICGITLSVFLGVALNSGSYSQRALRSLAKGIQRTVLAFVFAVGVTALAVFFFRAGEQFSRVVVALGAMFGLALLIAGRAAFHAAVRALGWQPFNEIVIVDGDHSGLACDVPMVLADQADLRPDLTNPQMLDRLAKLLARQDRVVIACAPEQRADWGLILKGANINGFIFAPELDGLALIDGETLGGSTLLRISCGPLDLRNRMLKRGLDLAGSVLALALLCPLLLATALAIKLDSPGPVFFRQKRSGLGNRLFLVFKFRSMRVEDCDSGGVVSTQRGDDRITRVGRFIRATSIDELPQLLNVLLGDMSFVGPRPHALGSLAGNELFWEVDRRYWMRHAIKPGITGLAQVRGFRGATHERSDLEKRLQADLEYLAGWTIWRDISILVRTLGVIVHKNAY